MLFWLGWTNVSTPTPPSLLSLKSVVTDESLFGMVVEKLD